MKKIIIMVLLLSSISFAQSGIYLLQAEIHRDDTAALKNISAGYGLTSHFPSTGTGYTIKVISNTNEELFVADLGISFIRTIELPGSVQLNETTIHVRVPVFPTAKYIQILRLDKKILTVDLSRVCNNNGLCDVGENTYICSDCVSGSIDDYCDGISDGFCDSDCSFLEDFDCYSGWIVFIVLIPVIFFLYKMHQKRKEEGIVKRMNR